MARAWSHGASGVVRLSNTHLRCRLRAWSCIRAHCVCVGAWPPLYTLQGMNTWLRGIPRACVPMRRSVLCCICDRVHVSVFAHRACDGRASLTVGGADQALAVTVWIYTRWYLLDTTSCSTASLREIGKCTTTCHAFREWRGPCLWCVCVGVALAPGTQLGIGCLAADYSECFCVCACVRIVCVSARVQLSWSEMRIGSLPARAGYT